MSYASDYRTQITAGNQQAMTHAHNKESRPEAETDSRSTPPPQHQTPGRIIAYRQPPSRITNDLVRVHSTQQLLEPSPYLAPEPPLPSDGQVDVVTFSQRQDAGIIMNQDQDTTLARGHGDRTARQSLSSLSGALTLDSPQSTGRSLVTPMTTEQHAHHSQQSPSTLPRIPELQTTQFPMSRLGRPAILATGTGSTASSHSAYSMNRDNQYQHTQQRQPVQRFHAFSSSNDSSVNYSVIQPLGSPETSYTLNVGQASYPPLPYQASQQWHAAAYHPDPSWQENPSAQYHTPHSEVNTSSVGPTRRSQYHSHHQRSHSFRPYERAPTASSGAELVRHDSLDPHGHVQHETATMVSPGSILRAANIASGRQKNSTSSPTIMDVNRTSSNAGTSSLGLAYTSPTQHPVVPKTHSGGGYETAQDSIESDSSTIPNTQSAVSLSSLRHEVQRGSLFESVAHSYQDQQQQQQHGHSHQHRYSTDSAPLNSPVEQRPTTAMTNVSHSSTRPAPAPAPPPTQVTFVGRREKRKDPRPHKCTICQKGFPRPSALSTHMSVHSGEKPYDCPVVTCKKSFAVRSNARRHLKTHGIKLKTREKRRKGGKRAESPVEDEGHQFDTDRDDNFLGDDADEEDEQDEQPSSRSNFPVEEPTRGPYRDMMPGQDGRMYQYDRSPVTAIAGPPDRGLGPATHRGHANVHAEEEPLGLGAALTMIAAQSTRSREDSAKVSFVQRRTRSRSRTHPTSDKGPHTHSHKRGDEVREAKWEMEMGGGRKLRTSREGVAANRSRRGFRSGDATVTDGSSFQGLEVLNDAGTGDDSNYEEVEMEEAALRLLCPVPEDQMVAKTEIPQLDQTALDKLIAPPTAWEGFQKQLRMKEAGIHSLDQMLDQAHGTSTPYAVHSAAKELMGSPLVQYVSQQPSSNQFNQESVATCGSAGFQYHLPSSNSATFLTSSVRSSYSDPSVGASFSPTEPRHQSFLGEPASLVVTSARAPTQRHRSGSKSRVSSSSSVGTNDNAGGAWRDDGTWIPASMGDFLNVHQMRNNAPFGTQGLSSVQITLPLPAVQPRFDGHRFEERNSYDPNVQTSPYHPYFFDRRPVLPGPVPPKNSIPHIISMRTTGPIGA